MVLTDGMYLECRYSVKKLWVEQTPFYHCQAKIVGDNEDRKVRSVSRNHLDGYNNSNVTAITFWDEDLPEGQTPRNIEAFFPNIEFYKLRLTFNYAIYPEDINHFPHLKYYLCQYNRKVTTIPPNMFANNPNLVGISIDDNAEIQHVARHVFDHLDKLTYLHISGPCINLAIDNDRNAVVESLSTLIQSCPPENN